MVVTAIPLEGWRASPTLPLHRELFGTREPAFAVLPGVVSGADDTPLRRAIDECRRLGLQVWGHAAFAREVAQVAATDEIPAIYPSVHDADSATLLAMCAAVADAGLPGAMFAGLERMGDDQFGAIRLALGL